MQITKKLLFWPFVLYVAFMLIYPKFIWELDPFSDSMSNVSAFLGWWALPIIFIISFILPETKTVTRTLCVLFWFVCIFFYYTHLIATNMKPMEDNFWSSVSSWMNPLDVRPGVTWLQDGAANLFIEVMRFSAGFLLFKKAFLDK